jgi:hypothetical protein
MKKYIRSFTIVLGVIVAILAVATTRTYADNKNHKSDQEIFKVDTEIMDQVEEMLKVDTPEENCEKRIKIFNSERQLIYECRGKDDRRIVVLLRRSDLMFQTDSSSYYLLGD